MAKTKSVTLLGVTLLITGCTAASEQSQTGAARQLAGLIVDVERQAPIDEATLLSVLDAADIVLLGERHGNSDHHRLQAWLVLAMGDAVDAVVFEMIDTDQQLAVALHRQQRPDDTLGLGQALQWSSSGWPDWALYEPIAAAAIAAGAEIAGGNLPRPVVDAMLNDGTNALDSALVARTGLAEPLDPALEAGLTATIDRAHCGFAPAGLLPAMLNVQRGRDALMADRLATLMGRGKAVLIAGAEHVRLDWGVPYYLARLAPDAKVVSVALREDDGGVTGLPLDLPYDFVWFTPAREAASADPCDIYRDQLERIDQDSRTEVRSSPAGR